MYCAILHSTVSAQQTSYNIHIHAVRVSNDNNSYPADITVYSLQKWIDYANAVYKPAGVKFLFEDGDFFELRSTLINSIDSTEGSQDWFSQKTMLDKEVGKYPVKLLVFFIYGDSITGPQRVGFSWVKYNFIIMPGFNAAEICGHQNIKMLAHEIGHYFGLSHTFGETFTSRDTLLKRLAQYGETYIDGDALSSTPPDPALYEQMECYDESGSNDTVSINGVLYRVPRNNVMSYYDYPEMTITDEQIEIIHRTLREHPFKKNLITVK